jgi:hypothetical protein
MIMRPATLRLIVLTLAAMALQGCFAKAVVGVVTLPVRAVSAGVDAATTSQSEADEKRGRAIRKREERIGEIERDYARAMERCGDGDDEACDRAQSLKAEQKALLEAGPEERDDR